jgi:hypothetical protein
VSEELKIPAGWKLVPEVATDAMRRAAWDDTDIVADPEEFSEAWSAMLAASPPPPEDGWVSPLPAELGDWLTAVGELYAAMGRPAFDAETPTLGVVETLREAARRLAPPSTPPPAALEPKEQHD